MKNKFLIDIWLKIGKAMGLPFIRDESVEGAIIKLSDKVDVFAVENQLIEMEIEAIQNILEIEWDENEELNKKSVGYWQMKLELIRLKRHKLELRVKEYSNSEFIFQYKNRIKIHQEMQRELTYQADQKMPEVIRELEMILPTIKDYRQKAVAIGKLNRIHTQQLTIPERNQLFQEMQDLISSLKPQTS